MQTLLGTYFDGDASRLALLLDPTRQHSPMHQFRDEVTAGFDKLQRAADRDRGRGGGARRRAGPVGREGRATSRTSSRRCSPTSLAAPATCSTGPGRRPASTLRSKKGDFVADDRPGPDRRRGRPDRRRGQGPRRCRVARSARSSARRRRTARPAVAARGLRAGPRAGRHRPVRRPRRRRLLRDRPGEPGPRHPRRGASASPGCSRSRAFATRRRRSTSRRSGRRLAGDPRRARGAQGHQGDAHVDREGRGRGPGHARRDSATAIVARVADAEAEIRRPAAS